MDERELARLRVRSQRLSGLPLPTAEAVVGWLGAVQSQEYGLAKWSVGQRSIGVTDAGLDAMLADGRILRTHILRPTWHFVLPADIGWVMALTGPRVESRTRTRCLELGLGGGVLERATDVVVNALRGGRRLTRSQIGVVLGEAGIDASAGTLAYVAMHAELNLLICSGGLDGKQQTYAMLEERVPAGPELSRDEALAELTRRYFTSHRPSTIADFTWWSSLTVTDAKRGLATEGGELEQLEVDGLTYWSGPIAPDDGETYPSVQLLQAFDEYIVGYQRTRVAGAWNPNAFLNPIIVNGQLVGSWRRMAKPSSAVVETKLMRTLSAAEQDGLAAAVARYGHFLGVSAALA